jgi:hypothetical protein
MKTVIVAAAILFSSFSGVAPHAAAQSAFFQYSGVPSSVTPGSSFTIGVHIVYTAGGNISNLAGLSYWMWQSAGTGNPFSITNRDVSGSVFTDLQSGNLQYPQRLTPINRNPDGTTNQTDLGALAAIGQPLGNGTYFVANLTFSLSSSFVPGNYTISNTTEPTPGVGGRFSVIVDTDGDTFAIAASPLTFNVIPEPGTGALVAVGLVSLGAAGWRRRNRVA